MRMLVLLLCGLSVTIASAQTSKEAVGTASDKAQHLFDNGFATKGGNDPARIFQAFELDSVPKPPDASFAPAHCPVEVPDGSCARGGKVYVSFIVERDGSCTNARVTQHVCRQFDAAALCTVEHWGHWRPGYKGGAAVRTRMVMPVECDPR